MSLWWKAIELSRQYLPCDTPHILGTEIWRKHTLKRDFRLTGGVETECRMHIFTSTSSNATSLLQMKQKETASLPSTPPRSIRRALGWLGIVLALPFFAWMALGFIPAIPNMIDVFGIPGLRTPAAVTIGGLLLSAFGFHET